MVSQYLVFESNCPILHVHVNLSIPQLALKFVSNPKNDPNSQHLLPKFTMVEGWYEVHVLG
jgi:hypothetical protein